MPAKLGRTLAESRERRLATVTSTLAGRDRMARELGACLGIECWALSYHSFANLHRAEAVRLKSPSGAGSDDDVCLHRAEAVR